MKQRGRKSSAALAVQVNGEPHRLKPPASLSKSECALFNDIVNSLPSTHFRPSDLTLLCRYVENARLSERAAQELRDNAVVDGKANPWLSVSEKTNRALVALSLRLRLAPQSRLDAKATSREHSCNGPRPWDDEPTRRNARNGGLDLGDEA